MENRFKFVCRVCLVKDSSSLMISLADQGKRDILLECTSVLVHLGDNYPQQMCAKCWNRCRDWSDFKTLAQDSDGQLKTEVEEKDFPGRMSDEVIVKEEQVVYLEGYSLAPEEQDLELENELMCGDGDDNVLIELRLENEEEDDMMAEAEVEIEKGNSLMGEGHKEEQFDYAHDGYEREQDTIEPSVGDAAKEQTMREGPAKDKDGKLNCGYCSKGFPTLYKLNRHERVHTNERPFSCDECGEKFKQKGHLKGHKLIHSGVKAFECDECDKKFSLKGDLKKHKLIHSGVKAFKCDECDMTFHRKSHLISHKQTHSNKSLLKCNECDKRFNHKSGLTTRLNKKHYH